MCVLRKIQDSSIFDFITYVIHNMLYDFNVYVYICIRTCVFISINSNNIIYDAISFVCIYVIFSDQVSFFLRKINEGAIKAMF